MRLIDADALPMHRVKIVHAFGIVEGSVVFPDSIKKAPTIDAVPVVLCQDCKHRGKLYECPMRKIIHIEGEGGSVLDLSKDDGFCDRGEARERDEH